MNFSKLQARILTFVFIFLIIISSVFLFYQQTIENYISDLPAHIVSAIESGGYSLGAWLMRGVYSLLPNGKVFPLILTFFVVLSIFAIMLLMKTVSARDEADGERALLDYALPATCLLFLCSIFIPKIFPYFYKNTIGTQPWHNSTYLVMRPLAVLTMCLFFKMDAHYKERLSLPELIFFTLLLLLTNFAKPNFIIGFAPMMLICLIYDFVKSRCKTFFPAVKFGICVLISLIICVYQAKILYPAGDESGIVFTLQNFSNLLTDYTTPLRFLCAFAFPLFMLICFIRNKLMDRMLIQSWLMLVIQRIEGIFLTETGPRATHGNLTWGIYSASLILFAVTLQKMIDHYKQNKIGKRTLIIGITLFSLHIASGIIYFIFLLRGGYYYHGAFSSSALLRTLLFGIV